MLYDPKWEAKTGTNFRSLEGLIAWLEKQPADTSYNFYDIGDCLICRYLKGIGVPFHSAGGDDYAEAGPSYVRHPLPGFLPVVKTYPHTYGAALKRARAAVSH